MGAVFVWTAAALIAGYLAIVPILPWPLKRKVRHYSTHALGLAATVLALVPLALLVYYLVKAGAPGLNWQFFAEVQRPLGEPGSGMKHAIVGSLIIVGIAAAIGVPIGVGAGIYLSEFGRGKFAAVIRFLAEVLTGLPSIIAGILAYTMIVVRTGHFSGIAGSVALSVLMIPVITRVTEESIRLVPNNLREASLALGAPQWRTIWTVILPAARSGILTGIVLAVARVGGETAPLLFTTAGQTTLRTNPNEAMAALPLSIYLNSNQPFEVSRQLAITGALFLVVWIAAINLAVRMFAARSKHKTA